jgi:hypothetical protein
MLRCPAVVAGSMPTLLKTAGKGKAIAFLSCFLAVLLHSQPPGSASVLERPDGL